MADLAAARADAVALLRECATEHGFTASAADPHYRGIWARDALITSWGALATTDQHLVAAAAATVRTLAGRQAPRGQVPAVVWPDEDWWDWADSGATDATALFALTACLHVRHTGDDALWDAVRPAVDRALSWLAAQDAANLGLVDSPEAADWMDSALNRGGKVLYVNVAYAAALAARARLSPAPRDLPDSATTTAQLNRFFWPEPGSDPASLLAHAHGERSRSGRWRHPVLPAAYRAAAREDRAHYVSHVAYGRFADACDVLGNALAVLTGLAGPERSDRILDFLAPAADPYPSRCWMRAVTETDDPWGLWKRDVDALQDPRWRTPPHTYHNGGVWPFVGAVHAAAAASRGRSDEARALMCDLADANALGDGYHEWLHGQTGEPGGAASQAWNAGAYLLADGIVEGGTAPLLDASAGT